VSLVAPRWAALANLRAARSLLPSELVPPLTRTVEGLGLVCENLQVTGSYKVRAMAYWMARFASAVPKAGLALASSGNFAIALAWAGRRYQIPVTAVMMRRSHPWKVERVRALGGQVVLCGDSTEERTQALASLQAQGLQIIDHLNDPEVLVGHSTLGLDLMHALSDAPSTVVVPASTGGLLVATALAVKQISPTTRVIGVQPEGANAMVTSFHSGKLQRLDQVVTECDALTANLPGPLPWELCRAWVDDMVQVSEQAVRESVRWLVEEAKLVVEPGGAAGLAALRSGQIQDSKGWAILSGGNMEPRRLSQWL